jgi:hypothetical protein
VHMLHDFMSAVCSRFAIERIAARVIFAFFFEVSCVSASATVPSASHRTSTRKCREMLSSVQPATASKVLFTAYVMHLSERLSVNEQLYSL